MRARKHQGTSCDGATLASIRSELDAGLLKVATIAHRHGLSERTVWRILRGEHCPSRRRSAQQRCKDCGNPVGSGPCLVCEARSLSSRRLNPAVPCSGCRTPSPDVVWTSEEHALCPGCHPHVQVEPLTAS